MRNHVFEDARNQVSDTGEGFSLVVSYPGQRWELGNGANEDGVLGRARSFQVMRDIGEDSGTPQECGADWKERSTFGREASG